MRTAHLIFAHPTLDSFNGKMRIQAIETLTRLGWSVTSSDLFQNNFKASADASDFIQLSNTDFFDLQIEQQYAYANNTFTSDIRNEQESLLRADLIILQFPLWWYSMPGILKGYIDRVFSYGFSYGSGKQLAGKHILVSTTTGAPENAWSAENRGTIKDVFKHLFVGTFGLCELIAYEPFIVYSPKRFTEIRRHEVLNQYQTYLTQISNDL